MDGVKCSDLMFKKRKEKISNNENIKSKSSIVPCRNIL